MNKNNLVEYVILIVIDGSLSRVHVSLVKPAKSDWVRRNEGIVWRKPFYAISSSSDHNNSFDSELDQDLDHGACHSSDSISSADSQNDVPLKELRTKLRNANTLFPYEDSAKRNANLSESEQDVSSRSKG